MSGELSYEGWAIMPKQKRSTNQAAPFLFIFYYFVFC
jgi:hypothetical protein